jgi:hypothetical protein
MRENSMFKVGDKVKHDLWGEGRVSFGPFHVPDHSGQCYLVENSEGKHFVGSEALLSAVPRFEVGQVVRSSETMGLFKVVAGPFNRYTGSKWYVLEDADGSQDMEYEAYMVPVVE